MKKTIFNEGWSVKQGIAGPFDVLSGSGSPEKAVTLPHDAMIEQPRTPEAVSGCQYGFYPASSYTYLKRFHAPKSWETSQSLLEFEGVMSKAMVYLNGEFFGGNQYGYSGFFVDMTPYLRFGQENTLKVLAVGEELASRWYPGAGIYRDVWLWQGHETCLVPEKQHITTVRVEDSYALVRLEGKIRNAARQAKSLRLSVDIQDSLGKPAARSELLVPLLAEETGCYHTTLTVDSSRLQSDRVVNFFGKGLYEFRICAVGAGKIYPRYAVGLLEAARKETGIRLNEEPQRDKPGRAIRQCRLQEIQIAAA